jgi:hypothetical protein
MFKLLSKDLRLRHISGIFVSIYHAVFNDLYTKFFNVLYLEINYKEVKVKFLWTMTGQKISFIQSKFQMEILRIKYARSS